MIESEDLGEGGKAWVGLKKFELNDDFRVDDEVKSVIRLALDSNRSQSKDVHLRECNTRKQEIQRSRREIRAWCLF